MKYALALMAVAGIAAGTANAQTNHLEFQTSVNGGAFSSGTKTALPGQVVVVRVRWSFVGTTTDVALAGFNFNPTLSGGYTLGDAVGVNAPPVSAQATGFTAADYSGDPNAADPSQRDTTLWILGANVSEPIQGPGTASNTGAAGNGRTQPWASASTASLYSVVAAPGLATVQGSNLGRVAIGQAPFPQSSFSQLFNNDGSGGPGSQAQSQAAGSFFSNGKTARVVFQFSFTVSSSNADNAVDRDILVSEAPAINTIGSLYRGTAGANANLSDNFGWDADLTSTIHIAGVPAPGALALLGLGGMIAGRRRR